MALVNLTLEGNKALVTLTLEGRGTDKTWNTIKGTWDDHITSNWNLQREQATLENKPMSDLSLEAK